MNKYVVKQISNQINWSLISEMKINNYIEKPILPVLAAAQMCWDKEYLHVRLTAKESEILARFVGDADPVCQDSCLEMFLCPIAEDSRYFNIEVNPNGASFFGFGHNREDIIRLHPWNVRELLNIETYQEGNFWSVRFDIPERVIRLFMPEFSLKKGHRMRANFYKCGEDIKPAHEMIWNPITNGNSDFHQSEFFGDLILQ